MVLETHSGGRIGCNHAGGICSDLDRVADAIARKKGSGPLHLMPASSAGQYRAMARVALDTAADMLSERMDGFYKGGVHTRAGWAVGVLRTWSGRER